MTESAAASAKPASRAAFDVERWAALVALVPAALWFSAAALSDRGPTWRAEYRGTPEWTGASALVEARRVERYWDRHDTAVPGGFDVRSFSVRYDTCMSLDRPRSIPFVLVSSGIARFSIDGREQLEARGEKDRVTRGAVLSLEPGTHHLQVDFSARGWPAIGLYASFGDEAPAALPPEDAVAGVEFRLPEPGRQGAGACSSR